MSDDRIPAYVDMDRLSFELSTSHDVIERWIAAGKFPPPKRIDNGKRLWKWRDVEAAIDGRFKSAAVSRDLGQEIEDHAKAAAREAHKH